MYYQVEGYGTRQCIFKIKIHIGEPKTYLFISF